MRILILSLSRCGSTALFYQIRSSYSPNLQCYFEPVNKDIVEFSDAENLLVKIVTDSQSQPLRKEWVNRFDKVITLVRDPRDRLISGLLFGLHNVEDDILTHRIQYLRKKEQMLNAYPFTNLVLDLLPQMTIEKITAYLSSIYLQFENVLQLCNGCHVFHYADFLKRKFTPLSHYLELSIRNEVSPISERHVHGVRMKSNGDWKNWLTHQDIDIYKPIFDKYIGNYGFDREWVPNANPVIESQFASEFVREAHISNKINESKGLSWRD